MIRSGVTLWPSRIDAENAGVGRVEPYGQSWIHIPPGCSVPEEWRTPTARLTDPATSHAAAAKQTAVKVTNDRWRVLLAMLEHGPLNDFQLAELTGRKQTSIGVRRHELCAAQPPLVKASGYTRPSDTGSDSDVHELTEAGFEAARKLARGAAA